MSHPFVGVTPARSHAQRAARTKLRHVRTCVRRAPVSPTARSFRGEGEEKEKDRLNCSRAQNLMKRIEIPREPRFDFETIYTFSLSLPFLDRSKENRRGKLVLREDEEEEEGEHEEGEDEEEEEEKKRRRGGQRGGSGR